MIPDAQLMFSDDQVVTGATSVNSTNYVDGSAAFQWAAGYPLKFLGLIKAISGALTFQAKLVGADDSGFSTNKVTLDDTGTITNPAAGQTFQLAAHLNANKKRYYRVEYTLDDGAHSVTVACAAVMNKQTTPEAITG